MEEVLEFLRNAGVFYLASVDKDVPHVRPFGVCHILEGKFYIQTGKGKEVAKQLAKNPKCEICAFKDGTWLRLSGEVVEDDRYEAKYSFLEANPILKKMYSADDDKTEVLYFKNAEARFCSFTSPERIIKW